MWDLNELPAFLEEETVHQVNMEQFEKYRYICRLLSGVYEVEFRGIFNNYNDRPKPVEKVEAGKFCMVCCKVNPTKEQYERSLIDKSEALIANQARAYASGKKCFFDNKAGKLISDCLKAAGYVQRYREPWIREGVALRDVEIKDVPSICHRLLEKSLDVNFAENRDALALKLIKKEPELIWFATATAMRNPDYVMKALAINPAIAKNAISPDLLNSLDFAKKLFDSPMDFDPAEFKFSEKVKSAINAWMRGEETDLPMAKAVAKKSSSVVVKTSIKKM
ncbi:MULTISPECIES: hypothetical protein [Burkholderia]|uniref:hypothetical protein n=1 Tax=Burkholderia TaxID=32008 RepID=UPI0005E6D41A|nr:MULTISPECIES: hypothetical protein [Burkholderia]MCW3498652.1 hypothetical protein [Burkholderia cenocepacia]MCW3506260.1 hypothetical protein [Burkholderia cenocepacia]MCW3513805.1 hypothetical protein [Burkholderia cenocepacia]MCW3528955.1 hypothetical protein [Burkholderia cenocepacia]MCW3544711.1 hypothetical protein [Burkholderia cenocepacia]